MAKVKNKKTLIVSERFYPEDFLVNELSRLFHKAGLETEVLTQIPSYPEDKIRSGYKNRFFSTEDWEGIKVNRFFTVLGYKKSLFRKILNYFCFAFFTSVFAICNRKKYDKVLFVHTGPLTMAFSNIFFGKTCETYIWTQDVWPDTVYAYGFKENKINIFLLDRLVKRIYRPAKKVFISSPGFLSSLKEFTDKEIVYIPQWYPGDAGQIFEETDNPFNRDKINYVFAGNIGKVQNLESVIDAFGVLDDSYALHICGDGSNIQTLQDLSDVQRSKRVYFHGHIPFEEIGKYLAFADALIISLIDRPILNKTLPAKFQAYLSCGKPLLGILKGVVADYINEYKLGFTADPDDEKDIALKLQMLKALKPEDKENISKQEAHLLNKDFNQKEIISQFFQQMEITMEKDHGKQ
ncbi:MAG: glycosyltransferase family 4 protein [Spirochaetales bacterium]|nr:glycosyltransferase family 4 protein [Spirochaetales bacterium]